jgi:hypothetical protein
MENFSYGSKPRMKEVPPGTEAIFSFNGEPEVIDTEYGEKFSFPITLISHDSHPLLENGPINMHWESKSDAAKQLYNDLNDTKTKYHKELIQAYKESKWQLTRFDTGVYWLDVK